MGQTSQMLKECAGVNLKKRMPLEKGNLQTEFPTDDSSVFGKSFLIHES